MTWPDRSPDLRLTIKCLRLPTRSGSGIVQTSTVAYSCGAVAAFHRASRSSGQQILDFPLHRHSVVLGEFYWTPGN
jgi:hypothetical protein